MTYIFSHGEMLSPKYWDFFPAVESRTQAIWHFCCSSLQVQIQRDPTIFSPSVSLRSMIYFDDNLFKYTDCMYQMDYIVTSRSFRGGSACVLHDCGNDNASNVFYKTILRCLPKKSSLILLIHQQVNWSSRKRTNILMKTC